jgi:hypothetical protein
MKIRILAIMVLAAFCGSAQAETFFVDCNLKGGAKMSPEKFSRVFWNRHTNTGKGNGGEAIDVLIDSATGDTYVTCVNTEDEDTRGNVYLNHFDGTTQLIGPVADPFGEIDPGSDPLGEAGEE